MLSNLRLLKSHIPFKLSELGGPSDDFCEWTHLITNFPVQWKQLVRCLDSPFFCSGQAGSSLPVHFSRARVLLSRVLAYRYPAELSLWTCAFSKPTAIALPLVSTLSLTTDVQFVTSRLLSDTSLLHMPLMSNRAQEQFVRAAKSFCLLPLSLSSLRPFGLALWVGKWESLMFRRRGLHSVLANLHPMIVVARHNWLSVVSVGHQSYVFLLWPSRNTVMFARMLALLCTNVFECCHLPPVSCQERPPVSPAVSCARFHQASTLVGI